MSLGVIWGFESCRALCDLKQVTEALKVNFQLCKLGIMAVPTSQHVRVTQCRTRPWMVPPPSDWHPRDSALWTNRRPAQAGLLFPSRLFHVGLLCSSRALPVRLRVCLVCPFMLCGSVWLGVGTQQVSLLLTRGARPPPFPQVTVLLDCDFSRIMETVAKIIILIFRKTAAAIYRELELRHCAHCLDVHVSNLPYESVRQFYCSLFSPAQK